MSSAAKSGRRPPLWLSPPCMSPGMAEPRNARSPSLTAGPSEPNPQREAPPSHLEGPPSTSCQVCRQVRDVVWHVAVNLLINSIILCYRCLTLTPDWPYDFLPTSPIPQKSKLMLLNPQNGNVEPLQSCRVRKRGHIKPHAALGSPQLHGRDGGVSSKWCRWGRCGPVPSQEPRTPPGGCC